MVLCLVMQAFLPMNTRYMDLQVLIGMACMNQRCPT